MWYTHHGKHNWKEENDGIFHLRLNVITVVIQWKL